MGCKRFLIDSNHEMAQEALKARSEAIKKIQLREKISGSKINQLKKKNYGYISFDIDGIKATAMAHSKVSDSPTVDNRAKYFVPKQLIKRYSTYKVGPFRNNVVQCGVNIWKRDVCAESKLFEILNLAFGRSAVGKIKLYTVRIPCISCDDVIYKFLNDHPNLELEVYFEENDKYNCDKILESPKP